MGQKADFSVTLRIYLRIYLVKVKKSTVFYKFVYIHERNPYQVSFLRVDIKCYKHSLMSQCTHSQLRSCDMN